MLESINELNIDTAILYASNQTDRNETEINYEDLVETEEYVLITDPIRRIADMKY